MVSNGIAISMVSTDGILHFREWTICNKQSRDGMQTSMASYELNLAGLLAKACVLECVTKDPNRLLECLISGYDIASSCT